MEERDTKPTEYAPGIRRTVALLQSWGFDTCDSGDGVSNREAGMECARDYPHVSMFVDPDNMVAEARHLSERLSAQCGIELQSIAEGVPCLQASYDPSSDNAVLDLMNVDDSMLPEVIG